MRALVQRVSRASVRVRQPDGKVSDRKIGRGLVILVGVGPNDDAAGADKLADKCANLRIFSNEDGKFDHSLLDVRGEALIVSQFTLYGDCRKGRRPDFTGAMPPAKAVPVYEAFVAAIGKMGIPVQTGEFGAHMDVELVNEGPVTLWLNTDPNGDSTR